MFIFRQISSKINTAFISFVIKDKYFIKKETSKSYSILDEEFYRGNLSFVNKNWKIEASFFNVDYEEFFTTLQLALDFIIEKSRTDLIRIKF